MQSDSGANRIVTDNMKLLENITFIKDYPMGGCNKEDIAIVCTAKGLLKLTDTHGNTIRVECYFSKDVDGTIVSPTAIVRQHSEKFSSFIQYSNCDDNDGNIKLIGRQGYNNFILQLKCINDLWYHTTPSSTTESKATVNRLSTAATFELWHQRLAHAGQSTMQMMDKHAIGIPRLKGNAFFRCPSCMTGKLCTKRKVHQKQAVTKQKVTEEEYQEIDDIQGEPGQHYHMDFGFVKGRDDSYDITNNNTVKKKGKIVKSIDGFQCYLIIIDRVTRYTWVFLSKNKQPPIATVQNLLNKFKSDNPNRTVRTDQGGELGHSTKFSTMIAQCGYALEETGPDASSQNGLAERPNRTFGQMMRCMLHSAELGPEFWSYAIIHAAYIKNRLYHHSIKTTPYQCMTGNKPDLSNLKTFGCRIFSKQPGKRRTKLDHHTSTGIFLGFTATTKIARYLDEKTGKIKTSTHAIYDEACMTLPSSKVPLAAKTLQILGYDTDPFTPSNVDQNSILIQRITPTATTPTRATSDSVGYDMHADLPSTIQIKPGQTTIIPTGLAAKPPKGTYIKIAPRSGLTIKKNLTTMAGIIDPDYTGEIKVVIRNFGEEEQTI